MRTLNAYMESAAREADKENFFLSRNHLHYAEEALYGDGPDGTCELCPTPREIAELYSCSALACLRLGKNEEAAAYTLIIKDLDRAYGFKFRNLVDVVLYATSAFKALAEVKQLKKLTQ